MISMLSAYLDRLPAARVLCVGDVMLDRYVYGGVERISPEAPIPVLRVERDAAMLGGAGNVAANVVALGATALLIGVIGDDEAGEQLAGLAAAALGEDAPLVAESGRQTTIKSRFIAGTHQLLRADRETSDAIAADTAAAVLANVQAALPTCTAMIISDYGKGVLSAALTAQLITAANQANVPVLVDPKGCDYQRYRGAAIVTPNRRELAEITGLPVTGDAEVASAAMRLRTDCGIAAVVATRSEQGLSVIDQSGAQHFPAEAREVFDVSGAGDTVVAALAALYGVGVPLEDAARLANVAAGIVVAKLGTATVAAAELLSTLHRQEWQQSDAKIVPLETALGRIARWRHYGQRVGFTNGCFDLLHPGHLSLLKQARQACDMLVVGLNSDASVKRLKGESRPVQSEAARAAVLASLNMVDLVVVFAEDTPLELIRSLRPDVLVKGADYTIDKVVGADIVQSYGGEVVLAELAAGHSTTATIARLNAPVTL